jgi:pSer/pThr/pTyr-binding forkhead associated (FHA) protein
MRRFTPQATPVAGAMPQAPFMTNASAQPRLVGPIQLLTPEGDFELDDQAVVLGRLPECDVPIHDDLASRKHARIVVARDGVAIEDLSSTNGVYVNGVRLGHRPHPLHEGDRLLIGTTELSVFSAGSGSFGRVKLPV